VSGLTYLAYLLACLLLLTDSLYEVGSVVHNVLVLLDSHFIVSTHTSLPGSRPPNTLAQSHTRSFCVWFVPVFGEEVAAVVTQNDFLCDWCATRVRLEIAI
jgi:hypothetical protein